MLRRKVLALSLVLILCLGTGVAFAVDENPPSASLLRLTAQANATVEKLIAAAVKTGDNLAKLHDQGRLPDQAYTLSCKAVGDALVISTNAVLQAVKNQCAREGVSYRCVYVPVTIGNYTVLIDPIIVPGNAD